MISLFFSDKIYLKNTASYAIIRVCAAVATSKEYGVNYGFLLCSIRDLIRTNSRKQLTLDTTLLLNASFEPLRVITWQRAITLSFLGKVEVVDTYEREVRSVALAIKVPAVVRLLRYVKLGRRKPPLSKYNLLARDNSCCQYCSITLHKREATIDHVVPRSQGGRTSWDNVVTACNPCNRKKGGRTPSEAGMQLLAKPVQPEWLPVLNVRFHKRLPEAWLIFLNCPSQAK